MSDNSGSAFPVLDEGKQGVGNLALIGSGLTKREYIAIHATEDDLIDLGNVTACAEFLGIPIAEYNHKKHWLEVHCKLKVQYADAMLKALNEETGQ